MAEAYESMTKVVTDTQWTVRVWCTESAEGPYDTRHSAVTNTVRDNAADRDSIATAVRTIEDWSAYEIIDRFGNGRVVYATWP